MKNNKSNKNRKMPNTAYYVIVVAIMVIINFFLLPRLAQEKVVEQTYDQFISESEEKKIEKVNVLDTSIEYKLRDDDKIYTVRKFEYGEDRDLINRLYANGAEIKRVSEKMEGMELTVEDQTK